MTIDKTERREPVFSTRLFSEQAAFAAMVWAGFTLFFFILTFGVSFVREIEVSGWNIAGQPARWFGFVIGIYLGWSLLQLHVTHGGTRKGYMIQMLTFVAAYAALLGALFAASFLLEAGLYALAGWPQVTHQPELYASPTDVPAVFTQWFLIFGLWTLGGLFIASAWYRSGVYGALAIFVGVLAASISTYTVSGDIGPINWMRQFVPPRPGLGPAIIVHLAMIAGLAGLTWLSVRDVPIHTRARQAA